MDSLFQPIMSLTPTDLANYILLLKYRKLTWFVEVITLSPGQSFGELALQNDQPRAATIETLKDSTFAIIGRKDYEKVLEKLE